MSLKILGLSAFAGITAALLMVAPGAVSAQTVVAGGGAAVGRQFSYSQIQCSDYFANRVRERAVRVIGSRGGLLETMFTPGAILYLNNAGGLQPGDQVRLLRAVSLVHEEEQFPGQAGMLSSMGAYVTTVGRAKVLAINGHQVATVRLTFSCQPAEVGDFVVAWRNLPSPSLPQTVAVDWTAPVRGRAQFVVMGRDHAGLIGRDDEVYLTGGAAAGARVGQAWTIFRTRRSPSNGQFEAATEGLPAEDPASASLRSLPEPADILGRLVVIRVSPRSATAIVTVARAPIRAGDEAIPAAQ